MRYLLYLILSLNLFITHAQESEFLPGQLIIQLNNEANSSKFIREFQIEQKIDVRSFNCISPIVNIYLIEFEDLTVNLNQIKRTLQSYKDVRIVQKNHLVSNRETIPSDELFSNQWYFNNTGAGGGVVDADIDATEAWDITTGGLTTHNDTIVVCVIEGSGVDISHEDLQGNLWKNYAEIPDDGIDNDGNGYIDDYDGWNVLTEDDAVASGSHGTRVSGMIGAKGNNTTGISGVNWDVKMMIIKGQQASTSEASVIAAYTYPLVMRKRYNETFGMEGAFVVATNASWGIDGGNPDDSPLWCAMYDSLGSYGIINVGATTNEDDNVDEVGDLPTGCTSEYFIGVTMTNNSDVRAGSGYGPISVDLAAPGYGVHLPIPGNSYSTTNGTSFATPCVTGSIALAYSAPCPEFINLVKFDPPAAALQMKAYILDGVDVLPALSTDVGTSGRLNIKNTIDLMLDGCDEDACISPFNMRIQDLSDTSVTVTWDGFSDDYMFTINGTTTDVSGNTISFDNLTPCTNYTFSIVADCGGGDLSTSSFDFTFETDGCCKNPPLLNPGKTESTLTVSWPEILYATQYNLRYAPEGTEDWTDIENVTAPIDIEGLDKCTDYDFQIHTVCDDSTRGFSETFVFRTMGCGACTEASYCIPTPGNSNLEWINSFSLNDFSIVTGDNDGSLISEGIITALMPGDTYEISITPGYADDNFTERHSVYIDFNQNGIFESATDRVVNDMSMAGTLTTSFTIPASAPIGITKIRLGMQALSNPIVCPTSSFFGEYEEYCVYIGPPSGLTELENDISLYPNPVQNQLYLSSSENIKRVTIYGTDGKIISQQSGYDENGIPTGHIAKGVYLIQVETESSMITKRFIKN